MNAPEQLPDAPQRTPGGIDPSRRKLPLDRALMALILVLQLVILTVLAISRLRPRHDLSAVEPDAPASALAQAAAPADPAPNAGAGAAPGGLALPPPPGGDTLDAQLARMQADMDQLMGAWMQAPAGDRAWPSPFAHMPMRGNAMLNRMMEDAWSNFRHMESLMQFDDGWGSLVASPTLDMRDGGNAYIIVCSLPGCDQDNVRVALDGRLVTIRSDSTPAGHAPASTMHIERRILLPGPVGEGLNPQAHWTNGVLRIEIPKATTDGAESGRSLM